MNAKPCTECGLPMERLAIDGFNIIPQYRTVTHKPGGPACRVRRWERTMDSKGLVRVDGEVSQRAVDAGFNPSYGPVLAQGSGIGAKITTGAFLPKWMAYVFEIGSALGYGALIKRTIERARTNTDLRRAIETVGDLSPSLERREKVFQLLKTEERDG